MELNVKKDDILIITTDGVLGNMNESEIEKIIWRGINGELKVEVLASEIWNIALLTHLIDLQIHHLQEHQYERKYQSQIHKRGKINDITIIVAYTCSG